MAGRPVRIGPVALTSTLTTNIANPPTLTGGVGLQNAPTNTYMVIRHIRIVNKTASAHSFSLWLGGSGGNVAGTEVIGQSKSVSANDVYDWYGYLRMDPADYLVGGADANTALTIDLEGDIYVA